MAKFSLKLVASITLLTTGLVAYAPVSAGFWPGAAWAQRMQRQTEPGNPPGAPAAAQPSPPDPAPIASPVIDPGTGLGSALASCDKGAEPEPLSLPSARGEVKLDRCYRGRDHLACGFGALLKEAKSLLDDYRKIVDSNYPEVGDVNGVCRIKPDNLATDLKNSTDFNNRFKALKAEYDARANCTGRIEQSLGNVILPDMPRGPEILKSMIESLRRDMNIVSALQAQLSGVAERMDSSHKAIVSIQKIHRAMCMSDQQAGRGADDRETRGPTRQ